MANGQRIGGVLSAIGAGLTQTSQAFVLDAQLKEKKEEMKQKELRAELLGLQLDGQKNLAAQAESEKLFMDLNQFDSDSERKAYLKLPKQQERIKKIQGLTGDDPEEIQFRVTNKTQFFRDRKSRVGNSLRAFAKSEAVQISAPDFVGTLNEAANALETAKDPQEFDQILKDNKFVFDQLKDFDRQFLKSGAISSSDFARTFKEVPAGTEGAQAVQVRGEGVVYGVPRKDLQTKQVGTSERKLIRDDIASNLGITEFERKLTADPDLNFAISDLEGQIVERIQNGEDAAKATATVVSEFKQERKEASEYIQGAVQALQEGAKSDDPQERELAKKNLEHLKKQFGGTLNPNKMDLETKLKFYRQFGKPQFDNIPD